MFDWLADDVEGGRGAVQGVVVGNRPRPATPGNRFLYPPPKLAMMCGSMQPMEITRSASATVLLSSTGVPRLVVPRNARCGSSQSGFSQCSLPASPQAPAGCKPLRRSGGGAAPAPAPP